MKIINLLPPARQKLLIQEAVLRALLSLAGLSLLGFALVLVTQFGVKLYLQDQATTIGNSITQLQNQVKEKKGLLPDKKFADINNYIADYKGLSQGIIPNKVQGTKFSPN